MYLPWGSTFQGGAPARELYLPWAVYLPGGGAPAQGGTWPGWGGGGVYLPGDGLPAQVLTLPCEQNDRQV